MHWDTLLAKSAGVPEAYDYGPERISWLATMSPTGSVTPASSRSSTGDAPLTVGDVTCCYGRHRDEAPAMGCGRGVNIEAVDQRGQTTAKDQASFHDEAVRDWLSGLRRWLRLAMPCSLNGRG